jgi:hypothetical protein
VTEIRLDVELAHPPERVWRALTDPAVFVPRPSGADGFPGRLVGLDSGPSQVGGGDDRQPGYAVVPGQSDPSPSGPSSATARPPVAAMPRDASALTAEFRTVETWVGGYRGEISVLNTGRRPVDGWTATITLPLLGLVVDSVHGAQFRQSGKTVTFTPSTRRGPYRPPGASGLTSP